MKLHLFNSKKKEFIRTDGQDTIKFVLDFEPRGFLPRLIHSASKMKFGQGKVTSKSCALARPYRQLFEEGKPVGRINYVFFMVNSWPSHILGSLCYTPGHRLLFYPDVMERQVNWSYSQDKFRNVRSTGYVDHITLEPDFKSLHLTILEPDGTKKDHLHSSKAKVVGKNTVFWFGLSMQDTSVLETTPEELTLIFTSAPGDSDRRIKTLLEARENAVFHLTTLDDARELRLSKEEFLHFDFFVGPSNLEIKNLPCFVPIREPIVSGYSQALREGTPFRGHPVSLEGVDEKVWVIVSKHIGKVHDKAIFTIL
jgi:hypothetical protein